MGRPPPQGGSQYFRFTQNEAEQMEKVLEELKGATARDVAESLAKNFNAAPERAGKVPVQTKQIMRWFSKRRYKGKCAMVSATSNTEPSPPNDCPAKSAIANSDEIPSVHSLAKPILVKPTVMVVAGVIPQLTCVGCCTGRQPQVSSELEFEAKSSKDGAWYDVATFLTHRILDSGEPEVRVRFAGFGAEEDEWVNVRKAVRQRSIPCEASDCVSIRPGDTVLCFREGIEQAIYFDSHVIDVQRKRHDVRGCRCRFLIRYDHDQIEERVPLRRVYRRPEI